MNFSVHLVELRFCYRGVALRRVLINDSLNFRLRARFIGRGCRDIGIPAPWRGAY